MGAVLDRGGPVRWGAALALLLCTSMAWAQEATPLSAFSLERMALNPGLGPMTLGNGELLPQGTLRVSVMGHYQRNPLAVRHEDERFAFIRDRTTGLLSMAYGVLPWLELDAMVPAVAVQQGADLSTSLGISPPSRSGLGAPWFGGRLGLLNPAATEAFHMALELGAWLPMGNRGALARDSGTSAQGRILVGRRIGIVAPAFEAGVLLRPTVVIGSSLGTQDRIGSEIRLGAGLTVGRSLRGEVAAQAAFSWEQSRSSAEVRGGLRYSPSPLVEVFALVGTGIGAEPGTPRFRALAGLAFRVDADPRPEPEEVVYELVSPLPRRSSPQEPSAPESSEEESSPQEEPRTSAQPESDTDGDGVADAVDACVRERGTVEQNGCPPGPKPLVTLTREQLVLHGQVFFETGVSTLPGPSQVLDRLAQVLLEHPEIQRVVIEGHTDTVGSETSNRTLSLARAETVRRYLIEKGVPGQRLVARGFGPRRPASTNATTGGRERNRRAELRLILGEVGSPQVLQAPSL